VIGRILIPVLMALCAACARLPAITPVAGGFPPDPGRAACRVFPEGEWQFLHSIKAELPDGGRFTSLGLTVLSSRSRTSRSVILTIEGLVVFDGEYDRRLTVHRALPPFDSPHFAGGLINDIRLVFFEPEGWLAIAGRFENGSPACRYVEPDGGTIDVERREDQTWALRRYDSAERLIRTVTAGPPSGTGAGFPTTIELEAHGSQNYKLVMTLVEAVAVAP
jgi:hypothetical protein